MIESVSLAKRQCLFINRSAPHGSVHPVEALEMAYALSALEHRVSLLFMDDGVYQLVKKQLPEKIGFKNFSSAFGAWEDYEIEQIYVEQVALTKRGIELEELVIPVTLIEPEELSALTEQFEFYFNV